MNSLAWMNFHLDYSWNYVRSLSKNSQNMERATAFHVLMYDEIITNIKLQHQNRVIPFKCLHEMISFWTSARKRLCWRYCFQINTLPICTTLLSILIMFLLCFICFNIFSIFVFDNVEVKRAAYYHSLSEQTLCKSLCVWQMGMAMKLLKQLT